MLPTRIIFGHTNPEPERVITALEEQNFNDKWRQTAATAAAAAATATAAAATAAI